MRKPDTEAGYAERVTGVGCEITIEGSKEISASRARSGVMFFCLIIFRLL
jgi:hypothetical protein